MKMKRIMGFAMMSLLALPLLGCNDDVSYRTIDSDGNETTVNSKLNVVHIITQNYGCDFKFTKVEEIVTVPSYLITLEDGRKMQVSADNCFLFVDSCQLPRTNHRDNYYIGQE